MWENVSPSGRETGKVLEMSSVSFRVIPRTLGQRTFQRALKTLTRSSSWHSSFPLSIHSLTPYISYLLLPLLSFHLFIYFVRSLPLFITFANFFSNLFFSLFLTHARWMRESTHSHTHTHEVKMCTQLVWREFIIIVIVCLVVERCTLIWRSSPK